MISPYKTYGIGCTLLFIIGISHLTGHFLPVPLKNSTEVELKVLMESYPKKVMGGKMTMMDIQDGLSLCYGLFFLFAGIINLIVLRKEPVEWKLLKILSLVNAIVFGLAFIVSLLYFFWLPVISCLSVALTFLIAWLIFSISDRFMKKI